VRQPAVGVSLNLVSSQASASPQTTFNEKGQPLPACSSGGRASPSAADYAATAVEMHAEVPARLGNP
jgi:hypothetical protein